MQVGQRVEWSGGAAPSRGVVVELPKAVDYDVDALMGRAPGESVALFGRLAGVRCIEPQCPCNTSAWTHSVNESQMRLESAKALQVTLW